MRAMRRSVPPLGGTGRRGQLIRFDEFTTTLPPDVPELSVTTRGL